MGHRGSAPGGRRWATLACGAALALTPLLLAPVLLGTALQLPFGDEAAAGEPIVVSDASPWFTEPVMVDAKRAAGEPSIRVARDGAIFLSAPAGMPLPSYLWRSTDGGATFQSLHLASSSEASGGQPLLPGGPGILGAPGLAVDVRNVAPGGGDTDLAIDEQGVVYVADLWLGSATVMQSRDRGATWAVAQPFGGPLVEDRPWLATFGGASRDVSHPPARVTVLAKVPPVGIVASTSLDGGLTFPYQSVVATWEDRGVTPITPMNPGCTCPPGVPAVTRDGVILEPMSTAEGLAVYRSPDGTTWEGHVAVPGVGWRATDNMFPALAVDGEDRAYLIYSDRGNVSVAVGDDVGTAWSAPVQLSEGTARLPYIAAHGTGAHAVWYEEGAEGTWRVAVAQTRDAGATWTRQVLPAPVHEGFLGRELLDFLSVTVDGDGWAHLAFATDVGTGGGARVLYARQVAGEPL
jgi:hypothetical protein